MDIDAFILIGGQSSRFGSPKAFAKLDGKTLAERAAQTVDTALSPRSIRFVVGSESQFASELILGLGHPVVADLKPGFGAWSGLHTALAYSACDWTFVLACDLPFVSAELIRRLAEQKSEDYDAIVPRQRDGLLQPLCALYRRKVMIGQVERRFAKPQTLPPIVEIFSAVKTRTVEPAEYVNQPENDDPFLNVNAVGDLPVKNCSDMEFV